MTVKELKAKLANIPEDASVEMVICNTDNPFEEGCREQNHGFRSILLKPLKIGDFVYPA